MSSLPAALAELSILARARSKAAEYYAPLLTHDDEVVRVGSWCALLDRDAVDPGQYLRIVALAAYGAIQSRAFAYFESNWEHELSAQVAGAIATTEAAADALARRAELACDESGAVEAQRYRYLATGRFDVLMGISVRLDQASGWRAALPASIHAVVLHPHEPLAAEGLLRLLYDAHQSDLLGSVLAWLTHCNLHPYIVKLYEAALLLLEGDAARCRASLADLDAARAPRPDVLARVRPLALRLNAEALEKLGEFREAIAAYANLNGANQAQPSDDYYRLVLAAAAQPIPSLPADPRTNHVTMTGFPRSGTTLLENALAAHPRIETFEEIPSVSSMQLYLDRALPAAATEADAVEACLEARRRYYAEEDRRHRKAGAEVFIDKMPMRASEAGLMSKMFPDKRYVFSIRHPFDVVLSCFKQQFSKNIAMEQFRTFEGAVRLYDFSMEQWFGSHTMDDPRVHYLRYDDLVTSFERSMRDVLGFLGVGWDPQVLDFARKADSRYARTPSYQKVRQGIGIGIQTSWRNYGFVFQSAAARPLLKWVEFFGYSAKLEAA